MATVYFSSLDRAEVVDVEFLTLEGDVCKRKLLVDSGFTGKSSVVLCHDALDLIRAELPSSQTIGALSGPQQRAWVTCRVPQLAFQCTLVAIIADISRLTLPDGVQGMVGLSFLRQFVRWGAERSGKEWRFFLSNSSA